nr:hypothetical protein [Tanacetum cinerariifolium]
DNWDIVSADFDDRSVYSISEGEEEINESDDEQSIEEDYDSHHAFMFHPIPPTKIADMVQSAGSWKPDKESPTQSRSCEHDWKENIVTNYTICYYCGILTTYMSRLNCPKCQLTACAFCARNYLGKTVNVKRKQQHKPKEEKDFSNNEVITRITRRNMELESQEHTKESRTILISKQGNIARSAVFQELDLDDNWDIVSVDFDDSSVYSISEREEEINESDDEQSIEEDYDSHHAFMFHPIPPTKIADMVICYYCGILTTYMSRLNCPKCQLTACAFCARNYLGKTVNVKRKQQHKPKEEKDFSNNEVRLLKELLKEKTKQVQQMIRDQVKEYYEGKIAMQEKEELWKTERSLLVRDLTDALKIIHQLKAE